MHKFIGFIAAAFAVLGAISIAMMFYGHANQAGMAILAFQIWGVIGAGAAVILGILTQVLNKDLPTPAAAKFAIGLGVLSLLVLIIALYF